MKKIFSIGITLVFLIVGLTGCLDIMPDTESISNDYDEDFEWADSDFVGTWKLTYQGNDRTECELKIKDNGYFTRDCITEGKTKNFVGRWFISDDFTLFCIRAENNYVYTQEDYRIDWINKDKVILYFEPLYVGYPIYPNWILERV